MAFWSDPTAADPKRQYRWTITFGANTSGIGSMTYALKKVDKPKAKIGSVQHKYLNHFFNYPGRLEWEDINMTFASITAPDATNLINNVLTKAGYFLPQNNVAPAGLATISKRKFNSALGTSFYISQLDANGNEIEQWEIGNPFFTSVQFGALDYANEEIVEITTIVKYDYAKLISVLAPNDNAAP